MSNLINLLDTYKGEKRELYPLTPSQMGVYLSCMHNPKGHNVQHSLHLCF